jgi:hypothetical protein
MRRSFNKLIFGALIAVIGALGAVNIIAQDDTEKTALYTKFTGCYKAADEAGITACIATGKDYMTKYGTPPDQYTEFVSKQLVNLQKRLDAIPLQNAYTKLSKGIQTKTWKDAFDGARDVIRLEPNKSLRLDVSLLMAEIGYDLAFATTPDYTYNQETINYAKSSIAMMDSGTVSESRPGPNNTTAEATWGGTGAYALKTKDNSMAWMYFIVGRLISDTNKDTTKNMAVLKEAAPYFYKAVKYESPDIKKNPLPYQNIGRYYTEELNAKVDEYDKTCKNLTEDTDQCKTILGMQLAYAERGLDAYARASKIARDDPKQPAAFKTSLDKRVSDFYSARFKKTDGLNDYVAKVLAQPMADPTAPVTPIAPEPVAPTTTTTGGTTTPATGTKPAATTTVKPATTTTPATGTKPATTTPTKPNGATKGTVAVKTPVKKKTGR